LKIKGGEEIKQRVERGALGERGENWSIQEGREVSMTRPPKSPIMELQHMRGCAIAREE